MRYSHKGRSGGAAQEGEVLRRVVVVPGLRTTAREDAGDN